MVCLVPSAVSVQAESKRGELLRSVTKTQNKVFFLLVQPIRSLPISL